VINGSGKIRGELRFSNNLCQTSGASRTNLMQANRPGFFRQTSRKQNEREVVIKLERSLSRVRQCNMM